MADTNLPNTRPGDEVCTDPACKRSGYHLTVNDRPPVEPYNVDELEEVRGTVHLGGLTVHEARRLVATLDIERDRVRALRAQLAEQRRLLDRPEVAWVVDLTGGQGR